MEVFKQKADKAHNNKYDYSKSKYINSRTKVKIGCPAHGYFYQKPSSHISKDGCPVCSEIRKIKGHLSDLNKHSLFRIYFVKVNSIWKVGVTSQSIENRFKEDLLQEIIYTSKYIPLERAVKIEKYIIKRYKVYKNNLQVMNRDIGNSETFTINILNKFKRIKNEY